jgi:hypothetical protein
MTKALPILALLFLGLSSCKNEDPQTTEPDIPGPVTTVRICDDSFCLASGSNLFLSWGGGSMIIKAVAWDARGTFVNCAFVWQNMTPGILSFEVIPNSPRAIIQKKALGTGEVRATCNGVLGIANII